jgi:hypothetical protein
MKKYSYLILFGTLTVSLLNIFVISGCSKENKVMLVHMRYIQHMETVTEISIWDCNGVDDNDYPVGMTMWDGGKITDQNSISNIMSAIKISDINPYIVGGAVTDGLICFKDSEGRIYCTTIGFASGKVVYGWAYIDRTGRLYDALNSAGLAPKEYP